MIYKLVVYVPYSALSSMKQALFDANAGQYGNYDQCSWQALGEGQFRPLIGSNPYLGQQGEVEEVREWRLEVRVAEPDLHQVIAALRESHPYEEPAYDVIPCLDI